MNSQLLTYFATCPRGITPALEAELIPWGARNIMAHRAGVRFRGSLEVGYRVCLWSRTASRVLLELADFPAADAAALYAGVAAISWSDQLKPGGTLAVHCAGTGPQLKHSHFAALKAKDAIVDQLRDKRGQRPDIDRQLPDLRIQLYLHEERATVYLDLAGESLHRRHYRQQGVEAPLKENLAAGLLLLASWPALAQDKIPFLDPMCGSGTLPLEAAMIATRWAPGLSRQYFGFLGWCGHQPRLWSQLQQEARALRLDRDRGSLPCIIGYDSDARAIAAARANARRAGLSEVVQFEQRDLARCCPAGTPAPGTAPAGLLLVNPPYGHRLGTQESLFPLYTCLGDLLKQQFTGWHAYVLAQDPALARFIGLRPTRRMVVFNGALECRLLEFPLVRGGYQQRAPRTSPPADSSTSVADPASLLEQPVLPHAISEHLARREPHLAESVKHEPGVAAAGGNNAAQSTASMPRRAPCSKRSSGAEMLANRLRKNARTMGRWARRQGISCFRVYDADLPEYAAAIDRYERWLVVQEYAPPAEIDPGLAQKRLREILSVLPAVLDVSPTDIFLKIRRKKKGAAGQYARLQHEGAFLNVHEGGHLFWVNFTDYLDTGLFLDHRLTRAMIQELADGRSFLNLFSYTGTATVYAAKGGARNTTSVDLSATYLAWAQRNLDLNGINGTQHQRVRADCLAWIKGCPHRYGLILLDPPTFSNSKAMPTDFEVERDQVWLLRAVARLLTPDGVLIFSTNKRTFTLDTASLPGLCITDLHGQTLPKDFARRPRIHHCWRISREK